MKMTVEAAKTLPAIGLKANTHFDKIHVPYLYQKRMSLVCILTQRMVVGDDVGLGKTLETIVAFSYLKARNPKLKLLVLTERSALFQWKKEIEWLTTGMKVDVITATTHPLSKTRKDLYKTLSSDVLVTTYFSLYNYLPEIMQGLGESYVVLADECVYFKNQGTKMFSKMRELALGAERVYGLTATIVENRLEEAYSILRVVAPGIIPSEKYFERTFCVTKMQSVGTDTKKKIKKVVGYKNLDQFRKLIEPAFYGRLQTDPEVEQDLPDDIHKNVEILLSVEQSKKVIEAQNGLLELPTGEIVRLGLLPKLTMLQILTNSPALKGYDIVSEKEETLIEELSNSLSKERVVIFSKYRTQIDRLEMLLKQAGIDCVRITGAEDELQRERAKERFMSDGRIRCNVMLLTKAGQRALNLQKGGHFVFFDMPWSYGVYRQLIGRLKRTGSLYKRIGVYRYMGNLHPSLLDSETSASTIDHHVLRVLMEKKELFNAVHGDQTTIDNTDGDLMEVYKSIKEGDRNGSRILRV